MIADGARLLVIAAVDGTTLTGALEDASAAGVKVLAYDRLIRNSPGVDYLATFDSAKVGALQAGSIVDALRLGGRAGKFSLELFAGAPDDPEAARSFTGALSVLQPFIDDGSLVVRSGETAFPVQVGTPGGNGASAQARMDNLLAAFYADGRVDAVLSPSDGISRGLIASLELAGYYTPERPGPVVTGAGAEIASVKSILAGEQTSTVLMDSRSLARQAASMADQLLRGRTVDVNDTRTFQNGARVVPTFLLDAVLVTRDNVQRAILDSGYLTPDQLE
jgi:putative multiple sugar transport system substrate-binding protein